MVNICFHASKYRGAKMRLTKKKVKLPLKWIGIVRIRYFGCDDVKPAWVGKKINPCP